jgi:hypothetical protein
MGTDALFEPKIIGRFIDCVEVRHWVCACCADWHVEKEQQLEVELHSFAI